MAKKVKEVEVLPEVLKIQEFVVDVKLLQHAIDT